MAKPRDLVCVSGDSPGPSVNLKFGKPAVVVMLYCHESVFQTGGQSDIKSD